MINRTLAYLLLLTATVMAGCVLTYNFYQAQLESKNLNWDENSFHFRQTLPVAAAARE